jgi:elongation factor G
MPELPPHPLIEIAIEPKSKADQEKLGVALHKLAAEDPTFRVSTDQQSGQTVLGGMSELQLDLKLRVLFGEFKVEANVGCPQVAYRETLGRAAKISYTHEEHTGRSGQFVELRLLFLPWAPGSGYAFENLIVDNSVPKEMIAGVERGLLQAKESGLLAGFPVVDFKALLRDVKYHDVDPSAKPFENAARAAFRELRDKASPKLLEPIMKVEVTAPEEFVGDVIGDLNSRLGMIQGADQRGAAQVIIATVPLANMFGYVNNLRHMSQGRADFHMEYDHYDVVPQARAPDPDPDRYLSDIGMRA